MTDLFVDLPMSPSPDLLDGSEVARRYYSRGRRWLQSPYVQMHYVQEGELSASYFIKEMSHSKLQRIVLEGAPGQGKSTVTQYVCQVMRMQLLDMVDAVNALPEIHKHAQIRIPFRVDLRDLAKWLSGIDPFQSKIIQLEEKETRSLEGLLAAQVRYSSGGHAFNVSDLTAIAKVSHLFIALDGFDEVADVELRKRLVDEISKGINRLSNAGGYSVQTVVTSRPVAFAKSVRFPREQWDYFELLPLERTQVDEYTSKWMTAKGLKENEKNALRRLLDTKLKEAHTQYLAKNPMQLTILLSLIHNRGASLPEKRTAMYDAYMDMFFSRESEKSDVVRDNRDVLIDIHRFLAWTRN
jgi:predicted NACHT family NTPase